MRRFSAMFLALVILSPVNAVENRGVTYVGGTATALKEGAFGRLDMISTSVLTFDSAGTTLAIPYAMIDSFEYSKPVAHHLGVAPAIAVGLVMERRHKHYFRITYHEENNTKQVVIFEVPKKMSQTLLAVLQARVPQSCKPRANAKCGTPAS